MLVATGAFMPHGGQCVLWRNDGARTGTARTKNTHEMGLPLVSLCNAVMVHEHTCYTTAQQKWCVHNHRGSNLITQKLQN